MYLHHRNGVPVVYINLTPHPVNLIDGELGFTVPSDGILNATPVEQSYGTTHYGIEYVTTTFEPTLDGMEMLDKIFREYRNENLVIIGSIIAAQAYVDKVVALIPAPGFERMPPEQKKMRADKFTVF